MGVSGTHSPANWGPAHDDVIKWKHFSRYWPFVRRIHRSPVNSPHKGQWRGALMFSLICAWINGWVNNGEAGDLRRHRAHYDVIVMSKTDWAMKDQVKTFDPIAILYHKRPFSPPNAIMFQYWTYGESTTWKITNMDIFVIICWNYCAAKLCFATSQEVIPLYKKGWICCWVANHTV